MISFCVHQILLQQNLKFEEFSKKFSSTNNCDNSNNSCPLKPDNSDGNSTNGENLTRAQLFADMLDWASRMLNSQPYLTTMTTERQQETRLYLERMVMSQLQRSSIIINDDVAEIDRDKYGWQELPTNYIISPLCCSVFHRELELIQKVVTPSQLSINKKFHSLLPFEAAQKELLKINCYKVCPRKQISSDNRLFRLADSVW